MKFSARDGASLAGGSPPELSVSRAQDLYAPVRTMAPEDLGALARSFGPLVVVVAQRNRGGLKAWPSLGVCPDLWISVSSGDEVARCVEILCEAYQDYLWPVLVLVSGASHARRRIERARYRYDARGVVVAIASGH